MFSNIMTSKGMGIFLIVLGIVGLGLVFLVPYDLSLTVAAVALLTIGTGLLVIKRGSKSAYEIELENEREAEELYNGPVDSEDDIDND